MAKKPIRIFRQEPDAQPPARQDPAPPVGDVKPPTTSQERVQVYKDGTNQDRLRITQQVVETGDSHASLSSGEGNVAYRDLLHGLYDGVLITDLDGSITEVNERAEHYFLRTKDELCKANIIHLISGADERLLTVIRENVGSKKYSVVEAICVRGDDSRFIAEIVANRMGDRKIAFFIRNITQRKRVEEELRKANEKLAAMEKMQSRIDTLPGSS